MFLFFFLKFSSFLSPSTTTFCGMHTTYTQEGILYVFMHCLGIYPSFGFCFCLFHWFYFLVSALFLFLFLFFFHVCFRRMFVDCSCELTFLVVVVVVTFFFF
ncbi:hypothetical protein, unlikely [Trypanosoma brucei gambiense DAL972]|uniref:T. brucei spp.-specific protein n=1 Tax=Trypanosoma brucei gambiense (strain MHOM/CI/86/DAL972) TaxID=679716 RepID=C9ZJ45_TRYB9|nr:hypothetical protein, unlikely [Trypanosoma brucei gambiense DAL972]CBH09403.1 hypothetical protein, unlikely [Trypanosoma brucei gambiense DAL972]|eukprot:XP_011771709.1 hypothetical protein, unlikely [Trypanosoma brucei gambiense DAL972]